MSFATPVWLLALALVPLALVAQRLARRRARRYAVRFTAVESLSRASAATVGPGSLRRHLPVVLALAAAAVLVLALAKPQRPLAVPIERAAIVLVTDHSRSMLATDVEPNRLRAAQSAARRFLDELPPAVQVGAVAYSDAPDAVQSPTRQHDDARRVVDGQIADGGTATGEALQVAIDNLQAQRRRGEKLPSAIVLLSDGKTTVGRDPVPVAAESGHLKIPIFTVSLGTLDALVPNPGLGPPLPAPPDPQTLQQIAEASGGRAFRAEDQSKLRSIYQELGSQLATKRAQREITTWFAAGGLLLLLGAALAGLRFGARLP